MIQGKSARTLKIDDLYADSGNEASRKEAVYQAQLFEDVSITENERIDRLDKVMRHETALHRQIDTVDKMLHTDAAQIYTHRLRDLVQEDLYISERECHSEPETDIMVELQMFDRMHNFRKETAQAANELSQAPLDTVLPDFDDNCENELNFGEETATLQKAFSKFAELDQSPLQSIKDGLPNTWT